MNAKEWLNPNTLHYLDYADSYAQTHKVNPSPAPDLHPQLQCDIPGGSGSGDLPGPASYDGLEAAGRTEPSQGPGQRHHYEPPG